VALDSDSRIIVADEGIVRGYSGDVNIAGFAATANGNVHPAHLIYGPNSKLSLPKGVALDASGNIYVADWSSSQITVYAAGSFGPVAPMATIQGSYTTLSYPWGLTIR
jgi:hypothetical protein